MADFSRPMSQQSSSAQSNTFKTGQNRSVFSKIPSTDIGTIVLHWVTGIALFVSLFTGLRIAADNQFSVFAKALSPILPQGEIWSIHFLAGLTLFFSAFAYGLYMVRSGLSRRIALSKARNLTAPVGAKSRWEAFNVILHWAIYVLLLVLVVTGIVMFLGHGGWIVTVHNVAALASLAYVLAHIVGHFGYGGWRQLLRVFNPARLVPNRATRARPLLIASVAGLVAMGAVAAIDYGSRDTLKIVSVAEAPVLDGDLSDAVWQKARPVRIPTQQGANFGGTGESLVEVRAVHDQKNVYFAFRWQDPSRSLRRVPIIKRDDGWHLLDKRATAMDVVDYYEDKLAIIFSNEPSLGGAGVTHLGPNPLPADKPKPLNERGFHYTTDGSYIDMWQWKASRGGMLGRVDDQYIGPPRDVSKDEAAYDARYQGGYWNDPGKAYYSYNFKFVRKGDEGPVQVQRLPKDLKATQAAMGKFDLDPDSSDDENGRWNMFEAESEPYTPEADALIPVGTVLPGVLIKGDYEGDRADLTGGAKWKDGWWVLETRRSLTTGSRYDKDFVSGKPLYMWVSAFDHNQTRHTRHARPVRIELK